MKYINNKYWITGLLIIFFSQSCKDLLEEPVTSFRTQETAFETEGSSAATLSGLYESLRFYKYYRQDYSRVLEIASVSMTSIKNKWSNNLDQQTHDANNEYVARVYEGIYNSIATTNLLISFLPEQLTTDAERNTLGQCLFVRASNYFNLVRIFGPTPIVTEANKDQTGIPRPKSIDEVYNFIISDLENSYELLADAQVQKEAPQKMAAYAMLACVYMQRASQTDNIDYWVKAKDYALQVINSGVYALLDDYANLFDLNNEFSSESIFEIGFSNNLSGLGSAFPNYYLSYGMNDYCIKPQSTLTVEREVVDTLLSTYGGARGDFEIGKKGIDYRMSTNMAVGVLYDNNGKTQAPYPYTRTPSPNAGSFHQDNFIWKYKDLNYATGKNAYGHGNNWYVLRYAEMFLIVAEAENEINGPTQLAIDNLNEILWRASKQGEYEIPQKVTLSGFQSHSNPQLAFRKRVMVERMNEFLGEAKLFFDERRRGEEYFTEVIEWHNDRIKQRKMESSSSQKKDLIRSAGNFLFDTNQSFNGVSLAKRNLVFPIPFQAISVNDSLKLSDQNPGY